MESEYDAWKTTEPEPYEDDLDRWGENEAFEDSVAEQEPDTEPCPDGCDHGGVEVVLESEYDDVPRRAFEADGKWWVDCETCGGEGVVPVTETERSA